MSHERNGSPRVGGGGATAVSREVGEQEAVDGLRVAQDGVKLSRDLSRYFDRFADAFVSFGKVDHLDRAVALIGLHQQEGVTVELLIEHRKVLRAQINEERARAGLPPWEPLGPEEEA